MSNVAIYWDFENVHASVLDEERGDGTYRCARFKAQEPVVDLDPVVEFAVGLGDIVINRAYCNWQWFGKYREQLRAHAVDLVQLFPLGNGMKNGEDIRLAIDVVEDLHQHPHITHVIIVAGDSDYVGLAQRCRRLGRTVIGVASRHSSNAGWIAACNEFKFYRTLVAAFEEATTSIPTSITRAEGAPQEAAEVEDLSSARDLLVRSLRRLATGRPSPWVVKAAVRPMMIRIDPTFDESRYGFASFSTLVEALHEDVLTRVGKCDHELAVQADLTDTIPPPAPQAATIVLN